MVTKRIATEITEDTERMKAQMDIAKSRDKVDNRCRENMVCGFKYLSDLCVLCG